MDSGIPYFQTYNLSFRKLNLSDGVSDNTSSKRRETPLNGTAVCVMRHNPRPFREKPWGTSE